MTQWGEGSRLGGVCECVYIYMMGGGGEYDPGYVTGYVTGYDTSW